MRTAVTPDTFANLYAQGFVRVGVASHRVVPGDPTANMAEVLSLIRQAEREHVGLLLFPELGITGYAIDDLQQQAVIQNEAEGAIATLCEATKDLQVIALIGAPLRWRQRLYNCAIAIQAGRILGVIPKSYLPNYREFYEARQFSDAASVGPDSEIGVAGQNVPFGTNLIFEALNVPDFTFGVEVCEDVWVPIPPSARLAMGGAVILANLSASPSTIGKADYRHDLCRVQSAQCFAAYLYSAAGYGESTTDLAWDGQAMIYENGSMLVEAERFLQDAQLITTDLDVETLAGERARHGSFTDCARDTVEDGEFRRIAFTFEPTTGDLGLRRPLSRFPYVPDDEAKLDQLCSEAFEIQSQGLARRLDAAKLKKLVVGISGGLDSSHALLVACHAFDRLGLPREHILAYTLPAYATSSHTKSSAWALMKALGVTASEVDITDACDQMLKDIGHPAADGQPVYDIAFENVQAGARTSLLFRLANHENAMVLGTGDLSELALGWCTYGVGDHMSHYNVNGSVSKTLIQHLIRWVAASGFHGDDANAVLLKILATEISPELVPGDGDAPAQSTEAKVGPYALQDFNLYHITRFGMRPSKVAFLASHIWCDSETGKWPPFMAEAKKVDYTLEEIRYWLRLFLWRFFQISQFKRSAVPNGPKISSGGSLSPRGDWRAPSDGVAAPWQRELDGALPVPRETYI